MADFWSSNEYVNTSSYVPPLIYVYKNSIWNNILKYTSKLQLMDLKSSKQVKWGVATLC